MSKYNWSRQETKDLITLYEINECLWNKQLREYKDRDERISSIQSISDEMKISIDEINKKIHNLRNQYRFELNKTKKPKVAGKPVYVTKWPYFTNLSFLENIVSVRGSNTTQIINNTDSSSQHLFSIQKYEEESSVAEKFNNNNESTVVSNNVPAAENQVFHVSVEYEERKPKIEVVTTGRKRRMVQKATTNGDYQQQQQLLNQYMSQIQTIQQLPSPTIPIIQPTTTTIIIDDKSTQDVTEEPKNNSTLELDEQMQALSSTKIETSETTTKYDKFEIFGLFIANEMRAISSATIQRKLKRKILECVLEVTDGTDST
ncbi:unnamed protein product [Diamesa serratosioi]